jgi:hypothetical protein
LTGRGDPVLALPLCHGAAGAVVLRERVTRMQTVGILLVLLAIPLNSAQL